MVEPQNIFRTLQEANQFDILNVNVVRLFGPQFELDRRKNYLPES